MPTPILPDAPLTGEEFVAALRAKGFDIGEKCLQAIRCRQTPIPFDAFLTGEELVAALREIGFRLSAKSLPAMRSRGTGPPFHKFGEQVVYAFGPALAWALARLRGPMMSTSEADAGLAVTHGPARRPPTPPTIGSPRVEAPRTSDRVINSTGPPREPNSRSSDPAKDR
jgi:hypothetical protein